MIAALGDLNLGKVVKPVGFEPHNWSKAVAGAFRRIHPGGRSELTG